MNKTKAYLCVALFGGLGIWVLLGYGVDKNPECFGRCFTDTLSKLIDDVGSGPASLALFASAIFSYFWWMNHE